MRQTSTLLLYIFLSITSAAPAVPGRESSLERPFTAILSVFHLKHTTTLKSEPHFPKHQLSKVDEIPNSPPVTIVPSYALDTELPLESSFLLKLAKDKKTPIASTIEVITEHRSSKTNALPSAPTSASPDLRAEDARKLELSLPPSANLNKPKCEKLTQVSAETLDQKKELLFLRSKLQKTLLSSVSFAITPEEINFHFTKLETIFPTLATSTIHASKIDSVLKKIASKEDVPYDAEYRFTERARALASNYDRIVGAQSRRDAVHGDVLVVAIVILFVIAVVIVEVADAVISSLKYLFGIQSPGAIRIPNDSNEVSESRRFCLMPAPKGRKVVLEKIVEEV